MVFEHLASSSAKTIPTLQLLVKIEMNDMLQGVAVSSFDQQLPKLLSEAPSYGVIKQDQSYFDRIKTYRDWDAYELSHKQMVVDNTNPGSPLQAAASLSQTYSLAWIEAFTSFIDETYMELTREIFSAARGWSLITRLASHILIEVAAPQNGVKQNFVTRRNDIIAQQIFWAVIHSHDIMARYKDK
jgi:hypothetical protein